MRMSVKPMANLVLIKETIDYDNDNLTSTSSSEEILSKNIYSFEELLEELESNRIFYGWSWERFSYRGNKLSIATSAFEEVMMAYAEERVTLHLKGVELDRAQIKMISKALSIR